MACFRFGDCHCFVAAALFLLGHLLSTLKEARVQNELNFFEVEEVEYYNDLQPVQVANTWITRLDNAGIDTAAIIITSVAWMFFAIVMIKLAWALSSGGKKHMGSSITIAVLAVSGSLAELLANLLYLGSRKAMFNILETYELNDWIQLRGEGFKVDPLPEGLVPGADRRSLQNDFDDLEDDPDEFPLDEGDEGDDNYNEYQPQDFNDLGDTFEDYEDYGEQDNFDFDALVDEDEGDEYMIDGDYSNEDYSEDGLGWKSLELMNTVSTGMVSLIDSVEFVLLAAIMVTMYMAVRQGASFSKAWTYLGLGMAGISLLQFILAISSMDTFGMINSFNVALMAINQVILFPIWLVWLGLQMKDLNESGIVTATITSKDTDDSGFPSTFS